jgi:hypothetical protein
MAQRSLWNEIWQGKYKYSEKTLPNATTNPTLSDVIANPGLPSEKPETKRLSNDTA